MIKKKTEIFDIMNAALSLSIMLDPAREYA